MPQYSWCLLFILYSVFWFHYWNFSLVFRPVTALVKITKPNQTCENWRLYLNFDDEDVRANPCRLKPHIEVSSLTWRMRSASFCPTDSPCCALNGKCPQEAHAWTIGPWLVALFWKVVPVGRGIPLEEMGHYEWHEGFIAWPCFLSSICLMAVETMWPTALHLLPYLPCWDGLRPANYKINLPSLYHLFSGIWSWQPEE